METIHGRPPGPFKRYVVFRCASYYPSGGFGDFAADFDDIEAARAYVFRPERAITMKVVDMETGLDVPFTQGPEVQD